MSIPDDVCARVLPGGGLHVYTCRADKLPQRLIVLVEYNSVIYRVALHRTVIMATHGSCCLFSYTTGYSAKAAAIIIIMIIIMKHNGCKCKRS